MKNKQAKTNSMIIIIVIIAIAIGGYFYISNNSKNTKDTSMSVLMYDKNGKLLNPQTFSIVDTGSGPNPNVATIAFSINIKNSDTIPLTFFASSLTSNYNPALTSTVKPTTNLAIAPGSTDYWITNQLNISLYEGYNTQFCLNVTNVPILNVRTSINKTTCVSVSVTSENKTNAMAPTYIVNITAGSGGSGNLCTENWTCSQSWTDCFGGNQSKTCSDINNCDTYNFKPANCIGTSSCTLTQSCSLTNFAYSGTCTPGTLAGLQQTGCKILVNTLGDGNIKTYNYSSWGGNNPTNWPVFGCSFFGTVLPFNTTENFNLVYDQTVPRMVVCTKCPSNSAYYCILEFK